MSRIWILFTGICVGFFLVLLRLFYWQIIKSESLQVAAVRQYFLEFSVPAMRGSIYTSDGKPLVMNQLAYLVYAQPKDIENIADFSRSIAPVLGKDPKDLIDALSVPDRVWAPLARKVDSEVVDKLKELNLKGIGFEKESKRFYPEGSMAAQLVGFVGSDENGGDKGYFGLEGYYDRELRGKDGKLQLEKDVRGNPIVIGQAKRFEPEDGRNLRLWLNRTIQYIAETKLIDGIKKYGAKEGIIAIMDPKTGGILAMANYPTYDPRRYYDFDKEFFKNPQVASSYEPGSTFKAVVMSAALEENLITPTTIVDETGPVQIGSYFIRTWNNQYHGPITMTNVLEHSSNVGMVFIQKKLEKERLLKYIRTFGFGKLTDIDLEEEISPELRSDEEWKEIDLATASFGQGIAVTPIQMLTAIGALANGGWLMRPMMVHEIIDKEGKKVEIKPKRIKQVISRATANVISEMLVAAVESGDAKWAKPKGYRIAGKTGTAQIPVAGHYDEKKTIASFVGYAPVDDPKFVMLVALREPTSSPWGSETAAPLFFSVARDILSYLGIAP